MSKIILYDLANKGENHCWSMNVWKTRLVLNFKQIEYTTEWMEFPEIAFKLKDSTISPNGPEEIASYTVPTILLPDNMLVMHSKKIAPQLETLHPSPSLHLDSTLLSRIEELVRSTLTTMTPVWLPPLREALLNPISADHVNQNVKRKTGLTIDELAQQITPDKAWSKVNETIMEMVALLKKQQGPFLEESPSYADLNLVAFMHGIKRFSETEFERFVGHDKALADLYSASAKWLVKDQ